MDDQTLHTRHGVRGTRAAWECLGYTVTTGCEYHVGQQFSGSVSPGDQVRPGMEDALLLAGSKSDTATAGDALREWENVKYRRTVATAISRIADALQGIAAALRRHDGR